MVDHATGYLQIMALAGIALVRIAEVRDSQNPTRLQNVLCEVETILNMIQMEASEHREKLIEDRRRRLSSLDDG
jgi:hypothetical protein